MKKLASVLVIFLFATLAFAQKEKSIPTNVKSTFQKKYPTAKNVEWDKEGENYEASFELRKVNHSILMDAQGNIIETEIGIEATQLPKGVLEYVKKHYPNKKIKEVAKITDAKETITYEVEIKGMDLIFNTNGVFVKAIKG